MKVFMIASLTANGFLARHRDDFAMDWTSPEDTQSFVRLTKRAGVVVMGSRTFGTLLKAGRHMPGRKLVIYSSDKSIVPSDFKNKDTEVTSESPAEVIKRLESDGHEELAVCGGATIYNMFMKAGVVDELYLTIEPKLFGQGINFMSEAQEFNLELMELKNLNASTIRLHYKVAKR